MNKWIFVTKNRNEAERLIPILAKENGGMRCFGVKELPKAFFGSRQVIFFDVEEYNKSHRNVPLYDVESINRLCAGMKNFLFGYLAAEKAHLRLARLEQKIRDERRHGKR